MRVLLVWELGGQFGHFGTLLPIAAALAAAGHEVVLVLKDLSHAHTELPSVFRLPTGGFHAACTSIGCAISQFGGFIGTGAWSGDPAAITQLTAAQRVRLAELRLITKAALSGNGHPDNLAANQDGWWMAA